MNNLDVTLDGMSRQMRMGSQYYCGAITVPASSLPATADCPDGDTTFAFEPYGNTKTDPPYVYYLNATDHRIYRAVKDQNAVAMTAPEVTIDSMKFYVVGSTRGCTAADCSQPKVVIVVEGSAPVQNAKASTSFHIQITAVQRLLDL